MQFLIVLVFCMLSYTICIFCFKYRAVLCSTASNGAKQKTSHDDIRILWTFTKWLLYNVSVLNYPHINYSYFIPSFHTVLSQFVVFLLANGLTHEGKMMWPSGKRLYTLDNAHENLTEFHIYYYRFESNQTNFSFMMKILTIINSI